MTAFSGSTMRSRHSRMCTVVPAPLSASTAWWCSASCKATPFTCGRQHASEQATATKPPHTAHQGWESREQDTGLLGGSACGSRPHLQPQGQDTRCLKGAAAPLKLGPHLSPLSWRPPAPCPSAEQPHSPGHLGLLGSLPAVASGPPGQTPTSSRRTCQGSVAGCPDRSSGAAVKSPAQTP